MSDQRTPPDYRKSGNERFCGGPPSGGPEKAELSFHMDDYHLLWAVHWWRILPYGYWVERDGAFVLFDRNYCPIVRLRLGERPAIVPPLERIRWVEQCWFYEDGTAPYVRWATLPIILFIAYLSGLEKEIEYRWALSDYGRIPYKVWAKKWKRR